ncbi:MAG: SpoIID/LytB domain-containing protein [Clostridia bacterium]|nr:SpoIID/LytB domain-containing protein [Clostridia bacterium]
MKRKICGVVVCLILILVAVVRLPIAQAMDPDNPIETVRIKLSMGSVSQTPVVVDGNYTIEENANIVLVRETTYTVKIVSGGNLQLSNSGGALYTGSTITFIQREATPGENNYITLDNDRHGLCNYLGDLHFDIENSNIRVINYIYIEEYLYGVVPYEMSNSWPIEALKAQAITARTYAARRMGGGDFDLVDSAADQTYHGFVASYTNAIAAVDGTAKQTLMSNGSFAETFYAASNGGQMDIAQHRWSWSITPKPYNVIKDDPFDAANPASKSETLVFPKVFSDTETVSYVSDTYDYISSETVETQEANALRYIKIMSIPSVVEAGFIAAVTGDIEIVGVSNITPHTHVGNHGGILNEDGSVKYDGLDYNGTNDCICYERADVTMTVLANKYVEDYEGFLYLGDVNDDNEISITDYTLLRLHILGLSELTEDQISRADINDDGEITITDYTMVRLDILELAKIPQSEIPGTLVQEEVTVTFEIDMDVLDDSGGLYKSFYSLKLGLFVVEETDTSWNIHQRRFGHGIGMSQRGAQQMANTINPETITEQDPDGREYTYDEILLFYYPNTTLFTLDIEKTPLTPIVPDEPPGEPEA